MRIPILVIKHRSLLNRFLGYSTVDPHHPVFIGSGGLNSQFQRIEHRPRITVGHLYKMILGVLLQVHPYVSISPLFVVESLSDNRLEIILIESPELEDTGSGDQCFVHLKVGIFGCGTDQNKDSILHVRQERILL